MKNLTKGVALVGLGMMTYGQLMCPPGDKRDAFFDVPFLALVAAAGLEAVCR